MIDFDVETLRRGQMEFALGFALRRRIDLCPGDYAIHSPDGVLLAQVVFTRNPTCRFMLQINTEAEQIRYRYHTNDALEQVSYKRIGQGVLRYVDQVSCLTMALQMAAGQNVYPKETMGRRMEDTPLIGTSSINRRRRNYD